MPGRRMRIKWSCGSVKITPNAVWGIRVTIRVIRVPSLRLVLSFRRRAGIGKRLFGGYNCAPEAQRPFCWPTIAPRQPSGPFVGLQLRPSSPADLLLAYNCAPAAQWPFCTKLFLIRNRKSRINGIHIKRTLFSLRTSSRVRNPSWRH